MQIHQRFLTTAVVVTLCVTLTTGAPPPGGFGAPELKAAGGHPTIDNWGGDIDNWAGSDLPTIENWGTTPSEPQEFRRRLQDETIDHWAKEDGPSDDEAQRRRRLITSIFRKPISQTVNRIGNNGNY